MLHRVRQVKEVFRDASRCTFVCVCIAEFLSIYETERLIQQLCSYDIDCSCVVMNQVVAKKGRGEIDIGGEGCGRCEARIKMQQKYLDQARELYSAESGFQLEECGEELEEVRGIERLRTFASKWLFAPSDLHS